MCIPIRTTLGQPYFEKYGAVSITIVYAFYQAEIIHISYVKGIHN